MSETNSTGSDGSGSTDWWSEYGLILLFCVGGVILVAMGSFLYWQQRGGKFRCRIGKAKDKLKDKGHSTLWSYYLRQKDVNGKFCCFQTRSKRRVDRGEA
uniref:Uncharacterized protein n=1 Tax=Kwoniella bestiolae CBS 10118 TaxID=1296100 RepID=A0A1B9FWX1_9TREE|nr:hypothetical protein I302_07618 [Kwoniella bestiolae CBS 10118]OCF23264.1 hypothetical protein I302_07618 [Kwoniella bestiolae CBS 10118]